MSFIKNRSIPSTFITKLFAVILCAALVVSVHAVTHAASLSLSPSSGSYTVGKTISVRVLVGSGGQSINAVSAAVSFSTDTLSLSSISKSGIISLWAQEPSYSNSSGTASLQGVVLNGYTGNGGTVVTLNFKAKAEGTGTVSISSAGSSVLLNDGNGTDVLSGTSGASFTIKKGAVVTPPTQPVTPTEPTAPVTKPEVPVESLMPVFTDYQSPLSRGNFVVVKGTASPNTLINIAFTQVSRSGDTTVSQNPVAVNAAGKFAFVSDQKVTEGSTYTLVASTTDGKKTAPLTLAVKNSIWFIITTWIASIIAVQMSIALAILILLIIAGYLLYRNHVLKKHLQMAIDEIHDLQQK